MFFINIYNNMILHNNFDFDHSVENLKKSFVYLPKNLNWHESKAACTVFQIVYDVLNVLKRICTE